MVLDEYAEFCTAYALPTTVGVSLIGDSIDQAASTQLGGQALYLVIQVNTAITAGSPGTIAFSLASDDTGSIATDGSASIHLTTRKWTTGTTPIPAGTVLSTVRIPPGQYERYAGLLLTTTSAALTAGKVNAFLTPDASQWAATADGVN